MKANTKALLDEAYAQCIEQRKSTEYTIQYLQDWANVDLDCVMSYLTKYKYVNSKENN